MSTYEELQAEQRERDRVKALFDENNTYWEGDEGHTYLVFRGSLEELAKKEGVSLSAIYDAFCEYEKDSREAAEDYAEFLDAKKGQY